LQGAKKKKKKSCASSLLSQIHTAHLISQLDILPLYLVLFALSSLPFSRQGNVIVDVRYSLRNSLGSGAWINSEGEYLVHSSGMPPEANICAGSWVSPRLVTLSKLRFYNISYRSTIVNERIGCIILKSATYVSVRSCSYGCCP